MNAKQLLLMRHAKSSWDEPDLDDFDRPLADRGRKAAPAMGREMARRGWLPDAALISQALRTRQTWELVAAGLPGQVPTTFTSAIYEAPADTILKEIRDTSEAATTLLVVGHSPGLEDLLRLLAADDSDADALRQSGEKFPTGALACFTFAGRWTELASARLDAFLRPKDLG